MKRATAVLAAFVSMLVLAAVAGAGPNSETAQGGYTLFGGVYDIQFSARATLLNTNASGNFKWINRGTDPDTVLQGDVTCLVVGPARTAALGGVVTSFTGPGVFTGVTGFYISVKDNGQGPTAFASDTSSSPIVLNDPPPASCTIGFTVGQSPIDSGDITVKPALP
jgi:hypothetical protein